jgi:hypothetical protein
MTEASVSFAGNLTDNPELRHTESGIARAMFRVAVSGRREQEPSFFTVIVWRDQAEHAAESLAKAAGSWSWASSSSRAGLLGTAPPNRLSRSWPRSLGRACDGRRRRPPGRHAAPSGSRLDRCDGAGLRRSMLAFRSVQQSNHCVVCQVMVDGCVPPVGPTLSSRNHRRGAACSHARAAQPTHGSVRRAPFQSSARERGRRSSTCAQENHGSVP